MLRGRDNQQDRGGSSDPAGFTPVSCVLPAGKTESSVTVRSRESADPRSAISGPQGEPIKTAVRQRFGFGATNVPSRRPPIETATGAASESATASSGLCWNRDCEARAPEYAPHGNTAKTRMRIARDRSKAIGFRCWLRHRKSRKRLAS